MALSFAGADGVFGAASNMPINRDTQTGINNNNVYMFHRHLVRVTDVEPKRVRVASSAGGVDEAPVTEWVGTTRPPHAAGYLRGFFTRYMDPTEITDRFVSLAGEFSNLAEIVNLPHLTHGYRRAANTVMGVNLGAPYAGQVGNFTAAAAQQAVIVESLAYGHEGGNDLFATFRNPGVAERAADREHDRQRAGRRPRDRRQRRAVQHGRAGRERDQRQSAARRRC